MKRKLLSIVFVFTLMLVSLLSACVSMQQMIQGTPTFTPTHTQTPSPTSTVTPTLTPTPTITPNHAATQQYESFHSLVQQYYDAGQISTMDGKYFNFDDFSDELAMDYGYQWLPTGVKANNFIVRAEFDWEVANRENFSGCGYIFRQISNDYYHLIALDALNGTLLAYTWSGADGLGNVSIIHTTINPVKKEKLPDLGDNPYHAIFTLIVNENNVYTYVNDNFYTEYRLKESDLSRMLGLSSMVLTGSETDFGTRCKITNAEMWALSP